jgi:hypothetical protein
MVEGCVQSRTHTTLGVHGAVGSLRGDHPVDQVMDMDWTGGIIGHPGCAHLGPVHPMFACVWDT